VVATHDIHCYAHKRKERKEQNFALLTEI
jgi:hypothetical protein